MRPGVPYVSPLRGTAAAVAELPAIDPAEPVPTYDETGSSAAAAPDLDVEPALPDEARSRAVAAAARTTAPLAVDGPDRVLHVRFSPGPAHQLVVAMEAFRQLVRERPGETRIVVHVPAPGGAALPMELRVAVAYDAELLAEVQRRLGEGIAELSLA